MFHLLSLHETSGSGNPLGISSSYDRLSFSPHYIFKDLITIFIFFLALSVFLFFMPNILGDSENYVTANPMQTPPAIVPEWYLLTFYAILRSIPNKLLGVIAMFLAIFILLILPFVDLAKLNGIQYRPFSKIMFFVFVVNFLILLQLGAKHVESPFIELGQICTIFYFAYFLILMPFISLYENSLTSLNIFSRMNDILGRFFKATKSSLFRATSPYLKKTVILVSSKKAKYKIFFLKLLNSLSIKKIFFSSFIIFFTGFTLRIIIKYYFDIDVFNDLFQYTSIFYYGFMAVFSVIVRFGANVWDQIIFLDTNIKSGLKEFFSTYTFKATMGAPYQKGVTFKDSLKDPMLGTISRMYQSGANQAPGGQPGGGQAPGGQPGGGQAPTGQDPAAYRRSLATADGNPEYSTVYRTPNKKRNFNYNGNGFSIQNGEIYMDAPSRYIGDGIENNISYQPFASQCANLLQYLKNTSGVAGGAPNLNSMGFSFRNSDLNFMKDVSVYQNGASLGSHVKNSELLRKTLRELP